MWNQSLCVAVALASTATARLPEESLPLLVRVITMTAIPEGLLGSAERYAGEAIERAGLQPKWVNCVRDPEPCRSEIGPGEVRLFVVSPARRGVLHPETEAYSVIFPAGEADNYAAVFYPVPGELPHRVPNHVQYLLGAAMAHEIGHILLGAKSHAPRGIMRAHFTAEDVRMAGRGELRFAPGEAARMRAGIRRRLNRSSLP